LGLTSSRRAASETVPRGGFARTGLEEWDWRDLGQVVRFFSMDSLLSKASNAETIPAATADKRDLLARLLARLAHEIRNPLSSLDIHIQLLDEDLAHAEPLIRQQLGGRLEIIRGELTRLENIVKRFLRLASPSALEVEPVRLEDVVSHVCKLLGPEAANHQIDLIAQVDPALPVLNADGVQLTQALLNLLINALQAVKEHGRVEVRVQQRPEERAVVLEVQDTGPGIPSEKLGSVFEPYFTTKEEGSGLGLWIAQQIALAHSGNLEAQNSPQGGAIFRLRLPLPKQEQLDG
jgi:signal transduction histidine kinase